MLIYILKNLHFVLDALVLLKCGSPGSGEGQFRENTLRSVTSAFEDDIVAADCSRIQVFSKTGKFIRQLAPKLGTFLHID